MRAQVSDRKRKKIILVSIILFVIAVAAIIVKVNSLTRNVLNNDNISANVKCIEAYLLSSGEIDQIKQTGKYGNVGFSKDILDSVKPEDGEICVLKFEFLINNREQSRITDVAMNLQPDEKAVGKVYGCSDMELVSENGGVMTFNQIVVMDRVDVYDNYFTDELPLDFEGPFKYELSYAMEGQYGRKTMMFTAALAQ